MLLLTVLKRLQSKYSCLRMMDVCDIFLFRCWFCSDSDRTPGKASLAIAKAKSNLLTKVERRPRMKNRSLSNISELNYLESLLRYLKSSSPLIIVTSIASDCLTKDNHDSLILVQFKSKGKKTKRESKTSIS